MKGIKYSLTIGLSTSRLVINEKYFHVLTFDSKFLCFIQFICYIILRFKVNARGGCLGQSTTRINHGQESDF